MKNMNLLAVVTPPSIYHGCSTRKMSWEEKFTGKENSFLAMNMKKCGRRNVREQKEIKVSDKYVTLHICSKFDSMDKMKFISSKSKGKLKISGKGLINSLCFKEKVRPQTYKKSRYAIRNVSKEDLFKIIREFEKFEKLPFKKNRPKHEPTDSYFYLARNLEKCRMISNTRN